MDIWIYICWLKDFFFSIIDNLGNYISVCMIFINYKIKIKGVINFNDYY